MTGLKIGLLFGVFRGLSSGICRPKNAPVDEDRRMKMVSE
jgi:hypothetical protein